MIRGKYLAAAVSVALVASLACASEAATKAKAKPKPKPQGIFSAGTTTLPAGDYRLINDKSHIEYHLTVDTSGTMMVKDMRSAHDAHSAAAVAPAAATAGTPATGAGATTPAVPGAVPAQGAGAAAGLPADATAAGAVPATNKSKLESLFNTQMKRNGPKLERQVKKLLKL